MLGMIFPAFKILIVFFTDSAIFNYILFIQTYLFYYLDKLLLF